MAGTDHQGQQAHGEQGCPDRGQARQGQQQDESETEHEQELVGDEILGVRLDVAVEHAGEQVGMYLDAGITTLLQWHEAQILQTRG